MNVKLLLKRGAIVVGANWPTVAIQFAARTTFQALLVIPVVSAAVLVAVLLGGDIETLLQGGIREMLGAVANALISEPVALASFLVAFSVVLVGGSVFMFLVKGGTVSVLLAGEEAAGLIEREPLHIETLGRASGFTLPRFTGGCTRLFGRYLVLGLTLMLVYGLSAGGYLAVLVYGFRSEGGDALLVGWTFAAAVGAILLVLWITAVNLVYLLLQIVIAVDDASLGGAVRTVGRFVRAEPRRLGGIFLVVFGMVVGATLVSALAWSGIALVAFVPLVGLVVIPLQIAGLMLRGLLFEFIGLTGLSAYLALYRRYAVRLRATEQAEVGPQAGALGALGEGRVRL